MLTFHAFLELVARMRGYQATRPGELCDQPRHAAIRECLERQVDGEIAAHRAGELRVVPAPESEAMRRGVPLGEVDDES